MLERVLIVRHTLVALAALLLLVISCSNTAISEPTAPVVLAIPAPDATPSTVPVAVEAPEMQPPIPSTTETTAATVPAPTTSTPTTTTTIRPPRDCTPVAPPNFRLTEADAVMAALELSRTIYPCAAEVGIAPAADPGAVATLVAAGVDGPLLLVGKWFTGRLINELKRLAPERVVVSGFGEDISRTLSDFQVSVLDTDPEAAPPPDPGGYERLWIVAPDGPVTALAVTAANLGIGLVVAEPDFRTVPEEARELIANSEEVDLLSDFGEDVVWQLDVVRRGDVIPGGGQVMFTDEPQRRLVAFYGHPVTSALGVLGEEQDPQEGIVRLKDVAAAYGSDGAVVLPTFEIIATVASAGAGRDGDYSNETDREVIRPWVEAAAANDVYVVLDLQPGRTDFLTQAKLYEEFLRLPHVGLALDPEWRLKPNQVHLTQIGSVDAAEVNEVVRWLAEVVREEALPQKLLIVHQFRFSMITNRELIETPPELAVVIQMDGQGSIGAKYNTWGVLTRGTEESGFRWGWKNFYDEDLPTATPAQVLELTPVPVFVSYQ